MTNFIFWICLVRQKIVRWFRLMTNLSRRYNFIRTCPTIMPILLAQLALVCSSATRTVKALLYINTRLYPYQFRACPAIMASLTTYIAMVMSSNCAFVAAQPWLWAGSSVMAFFPTNATHELPIYQTTFQFWTVVSPMPLTSTVSAIKFHSCIPEMKQIKAMRKEAV